MDIKRTILLVALAVVSYLMILQWNQDYGQAELPAEIAQTQGSLPSLPQMPNNPDGSQADVPSLASQQPATAPSGETSGNALIRVRTDVLELAIDPHGGDVMDLRLVQYPRRQDRPDVPFQLFERSGSRTYEAQSGLIGDGPDQPGSRPLYTSEQRQYQLVDGQEQLVVNLSYSANGINYIKRFTFERGNYDLHVDYLIDNQSGNPWTGHMFGQLKRDASSDPSSTTATGTATYLGAALWTPDEPYRKISMKNMDEQGLRETVQGGWIAWLQHYFVTAWIPAKDSVNQIQTRKDNLGNYIVGFTGQAVSVAPGSQGQVGATLYAGPKNQDVLKTLSPGLELTVDYGFLWFIAQPIFWLLQVIHNLLGNWGWSIIFLTLFIKAAFFPLSAASYRSMARMRAVAPRLQALKEQHGDDRQKMSQAMMELYKKEKINPLGGCLPILVQMPVFLSLYWVLLESVEMRQAPWLGWITDLSTKDPYFILPLIMGGTMFIQQQLNPTPPDPMQAKVMKLMPIIFTFFFLWFPAGLVLYWVVNNVLSIAQQWYITRQIEKSTKTA
ncbi:membrane protein insertase YidC [Azomonas macrocytogenes]|uniref:Membrane protein insertase YidC n=1 Tax=Azomonas macrocytogenes TaxID=69962 RepID=A0A839T2W3_AZOMA|nr:membrane protein insertase YidC [Azomonas macrocytogenes]MBB3102990.1 YidC/Oxa1 family membrane protein insertase [Azomonas macrocytogenes]